jgi:hypothetical protein
MFSNLDITSLFETKTLFTFALGLLIIVLFSKDKFNVPTHDKILMGPFAQLPPQSLTIDSRYKWGLFVYLSLLIAVYTAITIIGAMTASSFDFMGLIQAPGLGSSTFNQAGSAPKASNSEIWPMIAATFMISTGSAGDSILGRIELYIRQYAHKSAYIPAAVSDLAFSLRNVALDPWLVSKRTMRPSDFEERKTVLIELIGTSAAKKFEQDPDREGEIAAWIRTNILFYALQQIFNKNSHNLRLDGLADVDDNKTTFDRFRVTHDQLLVHFSVAENQLASGVEQVHREVQKFSRETSLTMAVLLLQAARNSSELNSILNSAGFQSLDTHDQSDHFGYVSSIILSILAGAAMSAAVLAIPPLFRLWNINWTNSDLHQGAVVIINGLVLYVVMFKVLDYSRDKLLDSQNWSESFGNYMRMTLSSSIITTAISIVLLVLILSLFNWVKYVVYSLTAFTWLVVFQEILAAIGIMFGLLYLRQAARLHRNWPSLVFGSIAGLAVVHACVAALLVCFIDKFLFIQSTNNNTHGIYERISEDFEALNTGPLKKDDPRLLSAYSSVDRTKMAASLGRFKELWDRERYGESEVHDQLGELSAICNILNKQPASKLLPPPSAPGATDLVPDVMLLFQKANECKSSIPIDDRSLKGSQNSDQSAILSRLVNSFDLLYYNIQAFGSGQESKKANYLAWMFPTFVTFLLAYAFGVGTRLSRALWLYSEVDREDGQGTKLKDLIKKATGDKLSFEKCLVSPIAALGYLTPLEALRYEDYRIKLFGRIQENQIGWVGCEIGERPASQEVVPSKTAS